MAELRLLLKRSDGLVDRALRVRLLLLVIAVLALSGLDALGVLLVVPLVEALGGHEVELPLLGSAGPSIIVVSVVGLFIFKAVAMAALRWWILGVTLQATSRASTSIYARLLRSPLEFHDSRNSADSVRLVISSVRNFFEQGVIGSANLVAESVSVLVLCVVLAGRSPGAGLVAASYLLLAMVIYGRVVQRRTTRHARRSEHLTGQVVQQVQEAMGALPELQVRGTADFLTAPFGQTMQQVADSRRRITFASEFSRYYLEIVFFGAVGVVASFVLVSEPGESALATLAVFVVVGFRILLSLARVLNAANRMRIGRAALELVSADLAEMPRAATSEARSDRSGAGPASLEIAQMDFRYQTDGPAVLEQVNLSVTPGSIVGIVGGSGSGKSTLLELICGLREPTGGSVELCAASPRTARPVIGYVPQAVFTVDASVADNVCLGRIASEEQIWSALETACLADFVSELPGGLQARVGEGGTLLSGGQRQRLGLARAYLDRPGLLILDEATSALDAETEEQVMRRLDQVRGGTTVIIVTHRPLTLEDCDVTYVVSAGRLSTQASSRVDETANEGQVRV